MRGEEEATEAGAGANRYALQNMDFHPEIHVLQRGLLESYIGVVCVIAVTCLSDLYSNNPVLLSAIGGDRSLLYYLNCDCYRLWTIVAIELGYSKILPDY